jgi:hypothetical protein
MCWAKRTVEPKTHIITLLGQIEQCLRCRVIFWSQSKLDCLGAHLKLPKPIICYRSMLVCCCSCPKQLAIINQVTSSFSFLFFSFLFQENILYFLVKYFLIIIIVVVMIWWDNNKKKRDIGEKIMIITRKEVFVKKEVTVK